MIDKDMAEDLAAARGAARVASVRPLCAYYRGVGICSFGCYEEPVCHTDEPSGGWHQLAYERWIDAAETARAIAAEVRGRHRDVKHLRDLARDAHRRAVACLRLAESSDAAR